MEGRTLVNYAMQIQDLVEEVEDHLQRRDVLPGEGFQFGAIDAAVTYLLPDILKDYMRAYPDVSLSAQVAPSRYLVDDLLMNRSEFAVISLPYHHPAWRRCRFIEILCRSWWGHLILLPRGKMRLCKRWCKSR